MTGFPELLRSEAWPLLLAAAAHLDLVVESNLVAVAVGVPLGIAATRSRGAERAVMATANVLQTIPSLALLGFLLIAFGGAIGKPPALAALVIYGLLPIIKNTILGIRSIDRGVAEAAVGLGMTPRQRLSLVELPLAVPIILGGVRVAAVASVGMATIAAAIGAKGLGGYIFRGVALSDPRLILLGSIPAALLALASDAALGSVESALDPRAPRAGRLRAALAWALIAALVGLAAFGAAQEYLPNPSGKATIVLGSKDGGEMILLGQMLAQLVADRTDLAVDYRPNLGGTLVCYNALRRGGLDAYVEYTGTALTAILKQPPRNDPEAVYRAVRAACKSRDGVSVLGPLGFENTFAILMRRDRAGRLGIRAISDLARHQATLRGGYGPEFMSRKDGYPGLVRAYGLSFGPRPREMDRNLLYRALALGSVDVAAGDSTDGRIAALDLVQLVDDRRYFPPYQAVPFAREETLRRHPDLRAALDALAGAIDAATMRRLNEEVDGQRKSPAKVARKFLREKGLIGRAKP